MRAAEADHDPDAQEMALRAELEKLSLDDIISFEAAFPGITSSGFCPRSAEFRQG